MKKLILACFSLGLLTLLSGCASGGDAFGGPNPTEHHAPMGPGSLPDAPNF